MEEPDTDLCHPLGPHVTCMSESSTMTWVSVCTSVKWVSGFESGMFPHRLIYLYTWSPAAGAILEDVGSLKR